MNIKSDNKFNLLPPHMELRKYVDFYNIVFPEQNMFVPQYTLMPNACGTLSLGFDGDKVRAEVWGASITPTLLGAEPNGFMVLLLIQLSPFGLYQLTRQNQAEFADKRISLEDIDQDLFYALYDGFMTSETVSELVSACDRILFRRMEYQKVSNILPLAAYKILECNGQIRVGELAREVGYSERQLNRIFLTQVGTNVKSYARLVRFNYVLKHIQKSPAFFAAISQNTGYFDQAHFDKDFKAISGVTPQEYMKNMSDFYYDGADELGML